MRTALRLLPLMVIGALAAFLLLGPLPQLFKTQNLAGGRPQTSSSPDSGSTQCRTGQSRPPAARPAAAPSKLTLPAAVWVNDPLGVNLREAASTSGKLITTLSQGTQASADNQVTDAAGNTWYHVAVGSQSGWLRADFMATYAVRLAVGDGWSLMLPNDMTENKVAWASLFEAKKTGELLPFLRVRTERSFSPGPDLPGAFRSDVPPVFDHEKQIQVWNFTVLERVSRVAIDGCVVDSLSARPDGGWPYMTFVVVKTSQRSYQFTFVAAEPDSAVVNQILNSAALS